MKKNVGMDNRDDDDHRNVHSDILNEGEFSSTPLEDLITMRLCPAFLVPQVRCRPRYVTRYPRYSGFVSVEVSQVLRYRLYWGIVGSLCTPLLQYPARKLVNHILM